MQKIARVAIVGASSLVGKELSDALSESPLGGSSFTLLDQEQLTGRVAAAGDEVSFIQPIDASSFDDKDLVFFTGDASAAEKYGPAAVKAGAGVIDLTYALEPHPGVLVRSPWVAPAREVQAIGMVDREVGRAKAPSLETTAIVPAHPIAAMLALVASRLRNKYPVLSMSATVLLPASEFGRAALDELHQQTVSLLSLQSVPTELYGVQAAFNVLGFFGKGSAFSLQTTESRIRTHLRLLSPGDIQTVLLNVLHVPVFYGYMVSMVVELDGEATWEAVAEVLRDEPFDLVLEGGAAEAPSNVNSIGRGTIRVSVGKVEATSKWSTPVQLLMSGDNLQLAAANAIACATELLTSGPLRNAQ